MHLLINTGNVSITKLTLIAKKNEISRKIFQKTSFCMHCVLIVLICTDF